MRAEICNNIKNVTSIQYNLQLFILSVHLMTTPIDANNSLNPCYRNNLSYKRQDEKIRRVNNDVTMKELDLEDFWK